MKKFKYFLLIAVLCFGMIGCNRKQEEDVTEDDVTEEEDSIDDLKMNSFEFKGITYEIPEIWEEKDISDESKYYYPSNGMLMISVTEGEIDSIHDNREEFIDGMKNAIDYMEVTQEGTILIDSQEAYRVVADVGIEGRDLEGEFITFNIEKGLAIFFMGTYQDTDSSESYKDEFDKILKSISFTPYVQKEESEQEEVPQSTPEEPTEEAASVTVSQENALSKAYDYLKFTAFSYTGLIGQLEYEGYSKEDATYAADKCGADWNEQAARKAQEYIDYSSFSRKGLIDQLIYEGFTSEQAEHGASAVGY